MRKILSKEPALSDRERKNLLILETIGSSGPVSKTDISRLTQLNIVTVSNYINNYMKLGLVTERGLDVSSGGRRPVLVELEPSFGYVIGVDLGQLDLPTENEITMIALMRDLTGNVISRVSLGRQKERMDDILGRVSDLVERLIEESGVQQEKIRGISMGVSGVIDEPAGIIRSCLRDGDTGNYAQVMVELESQFGIPVYIGNDATLAAYGEFMARPDVEVNHMLYLYSDIGAGMIIRGEIYCGTSGSAGEVTMNFPRESDSFTLCGSSLNCLVRPHGLYYEVALHARQMIQDDGAVLPKTQAFVEKAGHDVTFETVVQAAEAGEAGAIQLLEEAGNLLGMKTAHLIGFLNPAMVVIGGGLEKGGAFVMDAVRRTVNRWGLREAVDVAKIVPSRLGDDAVAMGAANLVVREVFTQI